METRFRLAITADLHLGSAFTSLPGGVAEQMRKRQEEALREICQYCSAHRVPYLFIAGDLFDRLQIEQTLLRRTQQSFSLCPETTVLIVPGNHDPYLPASFWDDAGWPENVLICKQNPAAVWEFPRHRLRVYPAAFLSQSAHQSILDSLEPAIDSSWINYLLIHGDLLPLGQSSRYNPIPREWLQESGLDLAILGHIHQTSDLIQERGGVWRIYPGCPLGRGFDECGEKGFYAGECVQREGSRPEFNLHFIPVRSGAFYRLFIRFPAEFPETQEELAGEILNQMKRACPDGGDSLERGLFDLILCGNCSLIPDLGYLKTLLAPQCTWLQLRDRTVRPFDLRAMATENTFQAYISREVLKNLEDPEMEGREELILSAASMLFQGLEGEIPLHEIY